MRESKPLRITGREKTIRELMSGVKYTIDYYQREYKWQAKNITELLEDLADKLLDSYDPAHDRSQVENYGTYFLGSIVISKKNGKNFIIDGQQRLTSLTLLLIYLNNLQKTRPEIASVDINPLVFSERYGRKSFNLDIPERTACMDALYADSTYGIENGASESLRNVVARYQDIVENFPDDLKEAARPYFIDWLLDNVYLVEITAYSDEDAYIIFETMNDRGLSLSPTDMLKGYLLSNITDDEQRAEALNVWNRQIATLVELGKDEEVSFFKTWLRAKYAFSIRERKKGALNQDFEQIGSGFHKWVRDNAAKIGLRQPRDFYTFIVRDLVFFCRQYARLSRASVDFTQGLEYVFYNAQNNFTLQYPLVLASLMPEDDAATVDRKIRLVAGFIDIFVARRVWNFRTLGYSAIVYTMFNVMREVRDVPVDQLAVIVEQRVADMEETFFSNDGLYLHQQNQRLIHHLLARMTYFIEQGSGHSSSFVDYVSRTVKKPFEIEHLWANKPERHTDEFQHPRDFAQYRNRIGGLVLLPRGFNQSLGDLPYEEKLGPYYGQNYLLKTLCPSFYEHNPSFIAFAGQTGLPFRAHTHFKKADLDERQRLYAEICDQVWSPIRFKQELGA